MTTNSPISPAEAAVLASTEAQGAVMLENVRHWAAINSGSDNLEGLAALLTVLAAAFRPLGGALALREADTSESVDRDGAVRATRHGRNLHLVQRPDAPFRLLLTGHMDTVFGAEHPFQTLRWIDANTLNGPGVADMKGGIAIILAVLGAIEASPLAQGIGYEVILNSDEEISSPGSAALLVEAARRVHVGLTYEPTQPDGTLAGARKGSGNFSFVVTGRAAHAGRNPQDGRNAIVAASDLAVRLAALTHAGLSVNPARIDGGGANNIVPDRAVLRVNLRPAGPEDQARAEAAMLEIVDTVAASHDVTIRRHGRFARPPKPLDANQLRLFELVRACGSDLGLPIGWRDTGGVCDGNNLAATGLAVVDTMGARGGAIHTADEYLLVDSLVERARLSALVILRLAAGALSGTELLDSG